MMAVVYVKLHKEGKLRQFINALSKADRKDVPSKELSAFVKAAKTLQVDWGELKEALSMVV
jgi:hypothetical protein